MEELIVLSQIYKRVKNQALCLDIEMTRMGGPISMIGLYKPQEGEITTYQSFVKGKNLTSQGLREAFASCKLLITYNGKHHDTKQIQREFPGVLPHVPHMDLHEFARALTKRGGLRALEETAGITRLHTHSEKKRTAVKRWQRYEKYGDMDALEKLIEYNKQDTINLYPLAEFFVKLIEKKIEEQRQLNQP